MQQDYTHTWEFLCHVPVALTGADFTNAPFTITIPATENRPFGPIFEDIQQDDPVLKFRVIDDNVNELEQSFALVAVLHDVPERFACFRRSRSDECHGRTGATEIEIVDNDGMLCKIISQNLQEYNNSKTYKKG